MKIGITGATGHLGRLVGAGLKKKAPSEQIVALVRSPEKAADLGVETRKADYTKPAELREALQGIDVLQLISASEIGKRAAQHHNIIEAARDTRIKRIVYTSLLHADTSPLDLAAEHMESEAEIKASGIAFVILRNGWYTENYTDSIGGALASGSLVGSAGEGKISSATRLEYADAAVAVLTDGGHEGKTYELAGDQTWTMADLATEISRQTGRRIPYKDLPENEYAEVLGKFGLPEGMSRIVAGWDTAISKGALFDDSRALSRLIGRPTAPLSASVAQILQTTP